eukprot:944804_1
MQPQQKKQDDTEIADKIRNRSESMSLPEQSPPHSLTSGEISPFSISSASPSPPGDPFPSGSWSPLLQSSDPDDNPASLVDNPVSFVTVDNPTSLVDNPTSFVDNPTSFVDNTASFVDNPASFVDNPTLSVDNPTSFIDNPTSLGDNTTSLIFVDNPASLADNPASLVTNQSVIREDLIHRLEEVCSTRSRRPARQMPSSNLPVMQNGAMDPAQSTDSLISDMALRIRNLEEDNCYSDRTLKAVKSQLIAHKLQEGITRARVDDYKADMQRKVQDMERHNEELRRRLEEGEQLLREKDENVRDLELKHKREVEQHGRDRQANSSEDRLSLNGCDDLSGGMARAQSDSSGERARNERFQNDLMSKLESLSRLAESLRPEDGVAVTQESLEAMDIVKRNTVVELASTRCA